MIVTAHTIFFILACGFMDRLRGDQFDIVSRTVEKLLYGYCLAVILGQVDHALPIALAFAVGISLGWGVTIGAGLRGETPRLSQYMQNKTHFDAFQEWLPWLKDHSAYYSLAVRGAMTGAIVMVLLSGTLYLPGEAPPVLFIGVSITAAFAVAFPLSIAIVRLYAKIRSANATDYWATHEYIRGWVAGAICYFMAGLGNG